MRGSRVQGRFNIDYEKMSMYEGVAEELGGTVGNEVDWWVWNNSYLNSHVSTVVDDVYDVSSSVPNGGRRWNNPFKMPVVMAQFVRGTNVMNQRGFYVTDTLRLVINVGDVLEKLPGLIDDSNTHIKDRIVYRGEVFVPTRVLPRGSFSLNYAVVTIDCNQMNPEELVNDPQFQAYATPALPDLRNL